MSLDEAYLDVTDGGDCKGSATLMARSPYCLLPLVSGTNQIYSKFASDENKPNGPFVVLPEQVDNCLLVKYPALVRWQS